LTTYRVLLSQTAVNQLSRIDSKQVTRVKDAMRKLRDDPFRSRPGADIRKLRLKSSPSLFRLRVGNYRVIYFVLNDEVRVTEIIHRSRGYSWLE